MRTTLLTILMILIYSCGRKSTNENVKQGSVTVIDLLSEPESEILSVSDIAADLEYLPLQTTDKSLVKSVTKVISCNNKIYLKNEFQDILCFDKTGKFLYGLNKPGRGPGEYNFIGDFDISSDDKKLIVISYGSLLVYNITENGFEFIKYLKFSNHAPINRNVSKISFVPGTNNVLLSIDPNTGVEKSLSVVINLDGDTLSLKPNHNCKYPRKSYKLKLDKMSNFKLVYEKDEIY